MACDICDKTGCHLEDVREIYRTREIRQVCDDCRRMINKQLDKIRYGLLAPLGPMLKAYMRNQRAKHRKG